MSYLKGKVKVFDVMGARSKIDDIRNQMPNSDLKQREYGTSRSLCRWVA